MCKNNSIITLFWFRTTIFALLIMGFFICLSYSQNETVGNNIGKDNTAFVFAPFMYQANRGEFLSIVV